MRFDTVIAALLAVPALAAPKGHFETRLRAREAEQNLRAAGRLTHGAQEVTGPPNDRNIKYSSNWAGVAREQPPPDSTYSAVSATFTVPEPTPTPGDDNFHGASAWVGIDGATYKQTILQAGVDAVVDNGKKSYHPWYEWYPDYAHDFDMTVDAGHVVVARIDVLSPSQGVAILENQSNGQSATKTLNAPAPTATLAGQNVEWIVEDYEAAGSMVGLVDFDKVEFTGAEAKAGDSTYGVSDARILEMLQDGKVLTDVRTESDHTVLVEYVGGKQ
jgi:hypothetical protein